MNNSIIARLDRAQDIYDAAAPPLAESYAKRKAKRGERGTTVRDLYYTGRTRRGMRLIRAEQNRAVIGFSDPVAMQRVKINNRRARQYGVSPNDREVLVQAVQQIIQRQDFKLFVNVA